jgi:hypothetical protein
MRVIVESGQIGSIPVLTMAEERVVNRPAVVFICGYGGGKEDGLSLGYRLAREGLFFIGFDPFLHGERYGRRLDHASDPDLGGIYPPETGLDTGVVFHEVIQRCLTDVETGLCSACDTEAGFLSRRNAYRDGDASTKRNSCHDQDAHPHGRA